MGFLKKFFRNVFHDNMPSETTSSFDHLTEEELSTHLGVRRYGRFELTDAVRPSYDLQVVPCQGFRHDVYRDDESNANVPVLMAAASREDVFETFMELLDPLGPVVDVVIETSHENAARSHVDLYREHIDMPVLKSILWDFEDLLTNDGCTGIAVLNPGMPQEVQLDEHKLLIAYGDDLSEHEMTLRSRDLPCDDAMKFITEAEHVHSTSDHYLDKFEQLKMRLGMDGEY